MSRRLEVRKGLSERSGSEEKIPIVEQIKTEFGRRGYERGDGHDDW
jgi:ribosomal protein S24E